MLTSKVRSSNCYSSTRPFSQNTVLVPVNEHRKELRGIDLMAKVSPTPPVICPFKLVTRLTFKISDQCLEAEWYHDQRHSIISVSLSGKCEGLAESLAMFILSSYFLTCFFFCYASMLLISRGAQKRSSPLWVQLRYVHAGVI